MAKQPTQEEKEVLERAKAFYGRCWRREICLAWMRGNYQGFPESHLLQQIRNNPNRDWDISTIKNI
jgi:biotin synthase-like enzyme